MSAAMSSGRGAGPRCRLKGSVLPAAPTPDPALGLVKLRAATFDDVIAACGRLTALVAGKDVCAVACDVDELAAEVAAIEALARLALLARRLGCPLRVRRPSSELSELAELCGLRGALGFDRDERQPEQREQPLHVEKRVDADDLAL